METANAARVSPKTSSGMLYILTLKAAMAKMLSEIPAEAQAGVPAAGTAAESRATAAAAIQTRKRAVTGGMPRSMNRRESHPPAKPPAMANTGGIHAYHADSCRVR